MISYTWRSGSSCSKVVQKNSHPKSIKFGRSASFFLMASKTKPGYPRRRPNLCLNTEAKPRQENKKLEIHMTMTSWLGLQNQTGDCMTHQTHFPHILRTEMGMQNDYKKTKKKQNKN